MREGNVGMGWKGMAQHNSSDVWEVTVYTMCISYSTQPPTITACSLTQARYFIWSLVNILAFKMGNELGTSS